MTSKQWSPIVCLPAAKLTPSGLLELDVDDGEVELMRRDEIEVRSDSKQPMTPLSESGGVADTAGKRWVDRDEGVKVSLTTHRIVFLQNDDNDDKATVARYLHLSSINKVHSAGALSGIISFASHKIQIKTYLGDLVLIFHSKTRGLTHSTTARDRDDMLSQLEKALSRKAWEAQMRLQKKKKTSDTIAARKVGVDAILAKNALRHKEAARLTEQAFDGDTETLLREAAELVKVIQKYVATLDNKSRSLQEEEDAAQLSNMLQNMGMTSALSKSDYRSEGDYHTTMARQIADFLRPKLSAVGGLITLTDIYCLFNRARGTNLISPEDLLQSVECMKTLKLGMSLREFPSGLKVVQADILDDATVAAKLKELAETMGNITAIEASRELHISALLAYEQLLASEQMGYLCRDDTLETTRFFPNRFDEFCLA